MEKTQSALEKIQAGIEWSAPFFLLIMWAVTTELWVWVFGDRTWGMLLGFVTVIAMFIIIILIDQKLDKMIKLQKGVKKKGEVKGPTA